MIEEKSIYRSLTKSQFALWTGQQLNPDAPIYNMAHAFDILGTLDTTCFRNAFQELVNDTEALRTVFKEKDGLPVQEVLTQVDYPLEILNFSLEDEKDLQQWLTTRSQRIFDLSSLLFDSVLIKINSERYIWFLNMHHLVTDATSSVILYRLMSERYASELTKDRDKIASVPTFQSFVAYEAKQQASFHSENIKDYWAQRINGLPSYPELYGRKNLKSTTRTHRVSVKIGKERSNKLRELAQEKKIRSWTQDLTLYNLFTTVLFSFLYRVSGQEKIAIGSPSHNRTTKTFKKTPGLFIELFPVVAEFESKDTFFEVLQRIKLEVNDYLKHAQPGMSTPEISRSFDIVLNYINANFSDFNGIPMKSQWIHPEHCDPLHQLRCHVYDMDASGEIEVYFDLNTAVFHDSLISRVPKHFLSVLDALLLDINYPIEKICLVSREETDKLLKEQKTEQKDFESITRLFEKQVQQNPTAVALRYKTQTFTYDTLNKKANQLSNLLICKGLDNDAKIALYLERSPEYIIGVLAILKAGSTYVPIPSDQPSARIAYILEDSKSQLVLTSTNLKEQISFAKIDCLAIDLASSMLSDQKSDNTSISSHTDSVAYSIYTSGSTGKPKGVLISQGALSNYINWARKAYREEKPLSLPLFTSTGFDLTITSTFLPLLEGGEIIIYKETNNGPDISLMEVITENKVNCIKLTPSHLALLQGMDLSNSNLKTMIVGGEDFKTELALATKKTFGEKLRIFNEYGPTEATVGCIMTEFNHEKHSANSSVSIGKPIKNVQAYILDSYENLVPEGVIGELYIAGVSLANGYADHKMNKGRFIDNPFAKATKMYRTGDLSRINKSGDFEYLGRVDEQVKLKGFRIELNDIEANMLKHKAIENSAVVLIEQEKTIPENEIVNCTECGLPSNYPNTDFDELGVCHICNAFKSYRDKAQRYFKTENELRNILISQRNKNPNYDCISLLSGGKDSTYILAQLVNMGLKVLAFTLDNGYISKQAMSNIDKIVTKLNVDHIYGKTEHMNKIFVDSLNRHQNVCNGCFKTIYTLSTQIALEKKIPFVITGLSRGQFFETRLTEELFWDENAKVSTIDETILEARKLYHQEEDAVKEHLDVSMFDYEDTFNKVQFLDFYRYSDVSLEEMLTYLKEKVDWIRPTDTGRSTNCLINQVGIYVHKKEKGYSNYSFPYSWDVRMGHKTRTETLEEINEVIDEKEVKRIISEIGYLEQEKHWANQKRLVGYYTGKQKIPSKELSLHLKNELPDYMVPTHYKFLETLPLTKNGKVDKAALKNLSTSQLDMETPFVAPKGEIEELLSAIWKEVLNLEQVGSKDDFIALGGHSLAAIRVTARVNEEVLMKFPLSKIFEFPTISSYANYIEKTLVSLME